jgi:hypothetical protein
VRRLVNVSYLQKNKKKKTINDKHRLLTNNERAFITNISTYTGIVRKRNIVNIDMKRDLTLDDMVNVLYAGDTKYTSPNCIHQDDYYPHLMT